MTFADTVNTLFAEVTSHAQNLGVFERVLQHEPKSAPGRGISLALWVNAMRPARTSGLASVSGLVVFSERIYRSFLSEPGQNDDTIDPRILSATCVLMGEYISHFTLDGTVRQVDVLGIEGQALSATAGYIGIDDKHYRAMEITLPVIVNDLFTEAA